MPTHAKKQKKYKNTLKKHLQYAILLGILELPALGLTAPIIDQNNRLSPNITIQNKDKTTNITSTKLNNTINWQDFSIKQDENLIFDTGQQKNNYLNIVTGNTTSFLDGKMSGGKNIYLLNPNGIIIGKTATINVGNLYLSTRPTANNLENYNADTTGTVSPLNSLATLTEADTNALHDVVNLGKIKAEKVIVEGHALRFQNASDIEAQNIRVIHRKAYLTGFDGSKHYEGYAHIGYENTLPTNYENTTSNNFYKLVKNKNDLQNINNDLNANYMLANDIDLQNEAFTPLGTDTNPFTGNIDGMLHRIKNLNIQASGPVGLFAVVKGKDSPSRLENIGFINPTITNTKKLNKPENATGTLAGHVEHAIVQNVYVEGGTVNGVSNFTGGIVGTAGNKNGNPNKPTKILSSYNTAQLPNGGGGIVGGAFKNIVLQDLYNAGKVEKGIVSYVGSKSDSPEMRRIYTKQSSFGNGKISGAGIFDKEDGFKDDNTWHKKEKYTTWQDALRNHGGDKKGSRAVWRIYEGRTLPLLTFFMQGSLGTDYEYRQFEGTGEVSKNSNIAQNKGKDVTGEKSPEYNSKYIHIVNKTDQEQIGTKDDVTYSRTLSNKDKEHIFDKVQGTTTADKTHNLRNAGEKAILWGDQHSYDLVGTNINIKKRKLSITDGKIRATKTYDGTTDATVALKKAFKSGNINTAGVTKDDIDKNTVQITDTNVHATYEKADAGKNIKVNITGSFGLTGEDSANYELDTSSTGNIQGIGDILRRKIYLKIDDINSIDKTYDGTADVTKTQADALKTKIKIDDTKGEDHKIINSNAQLKANNTTPQYVDKQDKATKNVAEAEKVLYSGILLEGTGKDNYTLLYNGQEITTDTIYLKGKILPRRIDSKNFKITDSSGKTATGTKVYDGTANYTLPNDSKLIAPLDNTGNTGVITKDQNKITFALEKAEFRKEDGITKAPTVKTAKKIAYQIKAQAHNLTTEDTNEEIFLQNYSLGETDATSKKLQTNKLYDVLGDGSIKKRTLKLQLKTEKVADKTYDGKDQLTKDIQSKANAFNQGYVTYADDTPYKLLKDENAQEKDTASINVQANYESKNVKRDSSNEVIDQNINYQVTLSDQDNYALTTNTEKTPKGEVNFTGKGKILPLNLSQSFKEVRKEYDGTTNVPTKLLGTNPLNGIITGDEVTVGRYDAEFFTKDVGSGSKKGDTNYIKYENLTFTGKDVGNYILPQKATTGFGEIYKKKLTNASFQGIFTPNSIEKIYDNTTTVEEEDKKSLTALIVDTVPTDHPTFHVQDANYHSKNVKDNKKGTHDNVTFDIDVDFQKVKNAERNYDFSQLEKISGQKYRIHKTTDGIITPKEIQVKLNGKIQKTYDGLKEVTDGNRQILQGNHLKNTEGKALITFEGLIKGDRIDNASKGTFSEKNVGTDKEVTYKLALSNTDPENYVFKLPNGKSGDEIKGKGDIVKRNLTIKGFTGEIKKEYDAKAELTDPQNKIQTPIFDDGLGGKVVQGDTLTVEKKGTFGTLNGTSFTKTADAGKRDIEYKDLNLQGTDAKNYNLVTQKAYGKGEITPRLLKLTNFSFTTKKISKIYDGENTLNETYQGKPKNDRHATVKVDLLGDGNLTDFQGTYYFRGTYASPDAATNKRITYHVEIDKNASKNYTFDPQLNNRFALQDQVRTDGEIKKRPVYFNFVKNLQKEYDGDTFIKDSNGNNLQGENVVRFEKKDKNSGLVGTDGVENDSTATYQDKNAGTYEVIYTPKLKGQKKENYVFYLKDTDNPTTTPKEYTATSTTSTKDFHNLIQKRILSLTANKVEKTYDGTSQNNDFQKIKITHKNGDKNDLTNTLLKELDLSSDYGTGNKDDFRPDENAGEKTVRYQNITFKKTTASDIKNNYTFDKDTIYGEGTINKLILDINTNFEYHIEGAKKTYDGTNTIQNADRFAKVKVKIGTKTITLGKKDYEVTGTYEGDINAGTNKKGTYTFKIKPLADTSNTNITYQGKAKTETKAFTDGIIKKRPLYFTLKDGFTKVYDNKTTVEKNEKILAGDELVALQEKIQTEELDTEGFDKSSGLIHDEKNISTATYQDSQAGKNKRVNYTLKLDKNSDNYEFIKKGDNTPTTTLYTENNEITKRKILVKTTKVEKTYDGTAKNDDFSKITYEYEGKDQDALNPASTIINVNPLTSSYGKKTPAGFTEDENAGEKTVRYTGFQNRLIDNNNYTIEDTYYGEGNIEKRHIQKDDLQISTQKASKTYDATTKVIDPKGKISLTLKKFPSISFDEFTVQDASYEDENTGTNKKVHYKIDIKKKNLKNFSLDDDCTVDFENADNEIYRRVLTPKFKKENGITKVYDGMKDADTENMYLSKEDQKVLQLDKEKGKNIIITKEATYDDENATINPSAPIENKKNITYKLTLTGNKRALNNYTLANDKNTYAAEKTYQKKGDIEKRKVFIRFKEGKGQNVDKEYDGNNSLPQGIDAYKNDFTLQAPTDKTGIISKDRDITLHTDNLQASYTSKDVNRDKQGNVTSQIVRFQNLQLKDTDATNGNQLDNYLLIGEINGTGTITPRKIFLTIKNAPKKVYDGTTNVLPEYNTLANFSKNLKNILPTDKVNLNLRKAYYHDKNASENKNVSYEIFLDNQNYSLVPNANNVATKVKRENVKGKNGITTVFTSKNGIITPKEISVLKDKGDIKNISKVYDGTKDITQSEQEIEKNIIKSDVGLATGDKKEDLNLQVTGTYTRKDATTSEDYAEETQDVNYQVTIQNSNYRLKEANTKGKGTITRKTLHVTTDDKKIRAGEKLPAFTGHVGGFIRGEEEQQNAFTYQPEEREINTNKPFTYDIYGWYQGKKRGLFGKNYTFQPAPNGIGKLKVELLDPGRKYHEAINPLKKFIPDDKSYQRASYDEDISHFVRLPKADITYQDEEPIKEKSLQQELQSSIDIQNADALNLEGVFMTGTKNTEKSKKLATKKPTYSLAKGKDNQLLTTKDQKKEIHLERRLPNPYQHEG